MYFSMDVLKHDRAAQLAVIAAHDFGEHLMAGNGAHIPFETVVCTLRDKLRRDTTTVAAQLMIQEVDKKRSAMKVGFAEIIRTFGGEEGAMNFFRQVTTPRAALRFESVGGVRDDIHASKNRSAVLAAKAVVERYRDPECKGYTAGEREYVDFLKSIHRTLDRAVNDGRIKPELAKAIVTEIEEAAYTDQRPSIKGKITVLQAEATKELFAETRSQLIQQYAQALHGNEAAQKPDNSPTIH